MKRDILVGLDAGTSVIKAVAFTADGQDLGQTSRPNSYVNLPNGGVEQDMRRTWTDTAAVLRELADVVPDLASRILALSVTGQGDGTWLIDAAGEPVHDGWLWLDGRAVQESREINGGDGLATIFDRTGSGVTVCQMRTQLRWIKRHAPQLVDQAATAFHCKDWLYFNLTGERATDPTEGTFTFGDFRTLSYSDDVLGALELEDLKHLLPPMVDGAKTAHGLTAAAAKATGLPEGLPVTLSYVDVMCSALASGLHDMAKAPGLSVVGSTAIHLRFAPNVDAVQLPPHPTGYTMPFPDRSYAQMQINMAGTLTIDWMTDLAREVLASEGIDRNRTDILAAMDDRVRDAKMGSAIFHPYISPAGERGPFVEPDARASFTGLDQSAGFFDMMRAVYEGLAFAARDCYSAMGPVPGEVRVTGGAARSNEIKQIMADVLGCPVRGTHRQETGAAGAAMIAALQLGLYADVDTCTQQWVAPHTGEAVQPDAARSGEYKQLFEIYQQTRQAMAPLWSPLVAARREKVS